MAKLRYSEANQIDMVEYLASLGYYYYRIRNHDYWYFSPFRPKETDPSFKIYRLNNVWYDHGMGQGGTLVDFGLLYFNCAKQEFLDRLTDRFGAIDTGNQPIIATPPRLIRPVRPEYSRIRVVNHIPLQSPYLLSYLDERRIPLNIANLCCREVQFKLYGKLYTAIGFPNNSGGYELRSPEFKGSSSPKDVTFFDNGHTDLAVTEGLFNFLSLQVLLYGQELATINHLVLNSLALFNRAKTVMEAHQRIFLFLDRDRAGRTATQKALQSTTHAFTDASRLYHRFKDVNDLLTGRSCI